MRKFIKTLTVILLAISAACAQTVENENSDIISDYGFNIQFEGNARYTKAEIDYTIGTVIEATEDLTPEDFAEGSILKAISPYAEYISIYVVEEKTGPEGSCASHDNPEKSCRGFSCEYSPTKWCEGLYDPNELEIKISHKTCIGKSALVHELVHMFSHIKNDDGNRSHSNSKYFGNGKSIEAKAKHIVIETLCSHD